MRSLVLRIVLLGSAALAPAARAQKSASPPPAASSASEAEGDDEIVVTGRAPPGAVIGDIPPENSLGPRAIASYGVGTVNELLAQIALMTGSAQDDQGGGPVVLVNGRRVSGVNEVGDLPTESILRVDILPEEVALKYGYSASQKVVNIILRRRFRSWVFNAGGGAATAGGGATASGDATITRIRDNDRLNIAVRASGSAALRESQRGITPNATATAFDSVGNIVAPNGGIIDPALAASAAGVPAGIAFPTIADFAASAGRANVTDDTGFRTLTPRQRDYSINAVLAHQFSPKITSSFNLRAERSTSDALIGLPSGTLLLPAGNPFSPFSESVGVARFFGDKPLTQTNRTTALHGGATVNIDFTPKWRLSIIGGYDHNESVTTTDRGYDLSAYQAALAAGDPTVSPYGPAVPGLIGALQSSRAVNRSDGGSASALLTGPLFAVPAGSVRTSLTIGGTASDNHSSTSGAIAIPALALSRTTGNVMASLDVPLASKSFLKALGTLTANVNVSRTEVSQFSTLQSYGYGLNWTPRKPLTLIAAVSKTQRAPSLQQLDSPLITTGNVRVYDYVTGQTALVSRTAGGNPNLTADDRRVFKLGATYKPFAKTDLTISANYVASRDRNAIGGFPGVSAALEAAFPERFLRDANGDLEAVDTRPVNFARQSESELRWGFDFTHILRKARRPSRPGGFQRWRQQQGLEGGAQAMRRADGSLPPQPADLTAAAPASDGTAASPTSADPAEITVTAEKAAPGSAFGNGSGGMGRRRGYGFGGGFGGGRFGRSDFRGGVGGGRGNGRGGGGGRGGFGRGDNGASLEISAYHTWIFRDKVLIRDGLSEVDLLNGGTLGGGAMPRHQLQFNAGINDNGVGLRLTGQWQSAAKVIGDAASTNGTLYFSSLGTVGAHAFINLQQRLKKEGWARGVRINLSITNLLDQRQKVRNAAGVTPLAYQPAYLDPLGRTVALSIRKIF